MSAFGFDPEQIFARRRSRPRIVRPPGQLRRRIIIFGVIAAIIVLLVVARWLLGLRADYLYYQSVGHTNVFWTPLIAHIVLFIVGFVLVFLVVRRCARRLFDSAGESRPARASASCSGAAPSSPCTRRNRGGSSLSGEWQDILVWMHPVPFGATDPVFHLDFSFFVFTLPAIDDLMGLLWGAVILGLLGVDRDGGGRDDGDERSRGAATAARTTARAHARGRAPCLGHHRRHRARRDLRAGRRSALISASITSRRAATPPARQQRAYVGLDATQRAVMQPMLGFLQVLAFVLAIVTSCSSALAGGARPQGRRSRSPRCSVAGCWSRGSRRACRPPSTRRRASDRTSRPPRFRRSATS